ncbi:Pyruvate/2-oxoglutarate dehydrogenase complex, dihydrolipoamide dehydrogenase (E3) component [Desulfuromusa kysingii]|uniref:Pyruvate/2-oxoglutarate dehydrogenase complex, dihydrolipoamide dehydrogenase (E3) component n=1 Tax=Desulfuromusa kysingii TaxID=37625 RepID=A0A1H3Y686_9BACT|nr:NAD(P)/FAD-dependent oxidoreductase [Desulfuromusa kysingii]SEA07145.1 Pyruvate/2-oxoglutarate dehydrogenase complex, dihydrolipoamide dehydrogenase (E3) component [Desulfuromusa kysingii]
MTTFDYDMLTIGVGPAGMAVSAMGAAMGLKVCAIEKNKLGGECMNVGCIPSKALLRMAKTRHAVTKFTAMDIDEMPLPGVSNPFPRIQEKLDYINNKKYAVKFEKVDKIVGQGGASFVDSHTVAVGDRKITAKRIFICTGTKPALPLIPGLDGIDNVLTNENLFNLEKVPESMLIVGGGAIGSEMAQAFSRLGCKTMIVQMDPHLLPFADNFAGEALGEVFEKEGIEVYNSRMISEVFVKEGRVILKTKEGESLEAERILVAAGRTPTLQGLKLENAGVNYSPRGIPVNGNLETNIKHIYALGDCNSNHLFSHSAMHQGMVALMNIMRPWPFKKDFRKYVVPWTVFTEPQVSGVGMRESELIASGIKYDLFETKYSDYGAAIAEQVTTGSVRVLASKTGRIYGASVVGEGSAEMINEWGLAIQKKLRLADIMMLQHSFPSMSFMNKTIGENWMMRRLKNPWLKRIAAALMR